MSDVQEILSPTSRTEDTTAEPVSLGRAPFRPPVELVRTSDELTFLFDLPGLTETDVHVRRDGHRLSIHGVRHRPQGAVGEAHRGYGEFREEVEIPEDVDASAMVSSFRHGVLCLRFSKEQA